jgi:1,2-phenylacetyl-CoA epoxidase PaaB subunit
LERGLYMIEIIREESFDSEQEKRELPKNIRQIGSPDIGDRIYIENKVHEYMHPYDALQEKTVYVLLGRFENNLGRQCVFVEAAICLEEIAFEGECPVWSDDSWAYLYKKLKHAYDNMVIVGWAMDIRGQLPNLTVAIEKLHRTYFGGEHQILYLMDSLEKEDAFYSLKNGYLKRRAGYYIYYEQKQSDLSAVIEEKREKDTEIREEEYEKERTNSYRNYLRKKEQKTKLIPSYGLSILLFFVVCGLGFAAFQNHQKMNAMETALMQMNHATAGQNRNRYLVRLCGRKNKDHIRRRLLQCFQQCVKRSYGKHMNLVNDVDFVFSLGRAVFHFLTDLTNVIHTIVGCRIDLNYIHGIARCDCFAGRTFPTGTAIHRMFAVDRLCKNLGDRRLTGSSGSTK